MESSNVAVVPGRVEGLDALVVVDADYVVGGVGAAKRRRVRGPRQQCQCGCAAHGDGNSCEIGICHGREGRDVEDVRATSYSHSASFVTYSCRTTWRGFRGAVRDSSETVIACISQKST